MQALGAPESAGAKAGPTEGSGAASSPDAADPSRATATSPRRGLPRSGAAGASGAAAEPAEPADPTARPTAEPVAEPTPGPTAGPTAAPAAGPAAGLGIASTERRRGLQARASTPTPPASQARSAAPARQAPEQPKAAPSRTTRILLWVVGALAVVGLIIAAAVWFRATEAGQDFIQRYPGETELPESAPVGIPAWLGWQHFLNAFFLILIIRSGWHVRTRARPAAYWTRNNSGLIKTKGAPKKISLDLWLHLTLDAFWVLNGIVFVVLLFATGHWARVVPTSWEVIPNALSAALQYASLDWPVENGWVNYNSLQVLAYFTTIFIAAPLAALSGIRMSPAWSARWSRASKLYPIELARAVHFPVMLYFVVFVIIHVALVLTTGAVRNLNHMYAAQDSTTSLLGVLMFAASTVVIVLAWLAYRPLILQPIASLSGKISRK